MPDAQHGQSDSGEKLCATCSAIHVTEGVIPRYCGLCVPPRERPDGYDKLTHHEAAL